MVEQAYVHAWAEVNDLAKYLEASEFGKVCQCLLAICFKQLGYSVTHFQFIGRPDFVVESSTENFSVEVKSSLRRSVTIKRTDISGIEGLGHAPVFGILTYPDMSTRWLVVDAVGLSARTYAKSELASISRSTLETKVSLAFSAVLPKYKRRAIEGASQLVDFIR